MLLDEMFGEANRIGIINWQKSYAPRNDQRHLSTATEYILVYAKTLDRATTDLLPRTKAMKAPGPLSSGAHGRDAEAETPQARRPAQPPAEMARLRVAGLIELQGEYRDWLDILPPSPGDSYQY
jgi:hypothetical protein